MRLPMFAASRKRLPAKRMQRDTTASCAAIFITQRSNASARSSTSTTATGLKAAPPLSKMRGAEWRFSAGHHSARATTHFRPASRFGKSQGSPHSLHGMVEEAQVAPAEGLHAPVEALRLLIVTDAWAPQVNGVVRTLEILGRDLAAMG